MGGNGPAHGAALLDVLATRKDKTLFVHAINRHFDQSLPVLIDISSLTPQPGQRATLHTLEGRLRNRPEAGEQQAPGRIRDEAIDIGSSRFTVQLPARSINVIEVPLFRSIPGK
jgi:alpha-L-arabinofuranosidase